MAMDIRTAEGGEMNANVTWFKHESIAVSVVAPKPQAAGAAEVRRAIKSVMPDARPAAIASLRAAVELLADVGGPIYGLAADILAAGLECQLGGRVARQRDAIRALVAYCSPDSVRATAEAIHEKLKRFEAGRRVDACANELRLLHEVLMNNSRAGCAPGYETIRAALGGADQVAPTQIDDQFARITLTTRKSDERTN
jgi:hypothetical protein